MSCLVMLRAQLHLESPDQRDHTVSSQQPSGHTQRPKIFQCGAKPSWRFSGELCQEGKFIRELRVTGAGIRRKRWNE